MITLLVFKLNHTMYAIEANESSFSCPIDSTHLYSIPTKQNSNVIGLLKHSEHILSLKSSAITLGLPYTVGRFAVTIRDCQIAFDVDEVIGLLHFEKEEVKYSPFPGPFFGLVCRDDELIQILDHRIFTDIYTSED